MGTAADTNAGYIRRAAEVAMALGLGFRTAHHSGRHGPWVRRIRCIDGPLSLIDAQVDEACRGACTDEGHLVVFFHPRKADRRVWRRLWTRTHSWKEGT